MKINRNNYEEFMLDYIEGNLDAENKRAFEIFLSDNEDIKTELQGFENFSLTADEISFDEKYLLKKTPISAEFGGNYFEEICIADLEKEITQEQKNDLSEILSKQPEKLSEYNSFQKTKLLAEEVNFPQKQKLHKKHVFLRKPFLYAVSSVAASILIAFSIFSLNSNNQNFANAKLAVNTHSNIENSRKTTQPKTETDENLSEKEIKFQDYSHKNVAETNENNSQTEQNFVAQNEVDLQKIPQKTVRLTKDVNYEMKNCECKNQPSAQREKKLIDQTQEYITTQTQKIKKIDAWDVAQLAVNNYNNLTESELKLDAKFDENGNMQGLSINSKLLGFYTNKLNFRKK